jgi:hypothetical protein
MNMARNGLNVCGAVVGRMEGIWYVAHKQGKCNIANYAVNKLVSHIGALF